MKKSLNSYYAELWSLPSLKRLILIYLILYSLIPLLFFLANPSRILFLSSLILTLPSFFLFYKFEKFTSIKRLLGLGLFFSIGFAISLAVYLISPFYKTELSLALLLTFLTLGNISLFFISPLKEKYSIIFANIFSAPFLVSYSSLIAKTFNEILTEFVKGYLIFLASFGSLCVYLLLIKLAIIKKYRIDLLYHLKSFLLTWLSKNPKYYEGVISKYDTEFKTFKIPALLIENRNKKLALLSLPVHPGPFLGVGSSELPSKLLNKNPSNILPFHGPSTHKEDLATMEESISLESLIESMVVNNSPYNDLKCSAIIKVGTKNFNLKTMRINDTALIAIEPKSEDIADDLPPELQDISAKIAKEHGLEECILIDAHNSFGTKFLKEKDIIFELEKGISDAINRLKEVKLKEVKIGFEKIIFNIDPNSEKEICFGEGALLVIKGEDFTNCIILIDSNNMKKEFRDALLARMEKEGINCIVCTTDSHSTTGLFNGHGGYYPLGHDKTRHELLLNTIKKSLDKALKNISEAKAGLIRLETPPFRVLGRLMEIYEKGTNSFIKYGKILPYVAFSICSLSSILIYPLL